METRHARPQQREIVRLSRRGKHPAAARAGPDVCSALGTRVAAVLYHPCAQAVCVEAVPTQGRAKVVTAREFAKADRAKVLQLLVWWLIS